MIYKTIDLCAGIGGIRKGFELTGSFKNVLSAEIDTAAAATYKHLFKEDPTNDLTSEEFKKYSSALDKAARKSVIHSNRAAAKKSDMMKKINAMN